MEKGFVEWRDGANSHNSFNQLFEAISREDVIATEEES